MKLHIWSHENLKSIVSIGNYSPRRCGIATFTSDLLGAIQEEATDTNCWAIAMNDTPEGYHYPERVRFEINQHQLSDYKLAAEFLNMNKIDIVNLQHEYGIFGGIAGSNIIRLISDLRMPVVTTLHTVLKKPTPEQKEALGKVIKLSSRIVVMSKKAISILKELYSIPEEKIVFIPHGIPDSPYIDPNYYKDQFGVEGKNVILTFGFISQNKGLEYAIKALPEIIKKHKDVVYIILGATHPHVLKTQGEEYRISLQQLAEKLGVSEHVIFQNRFVELNELCEFLGIADIYITPYINEDQIVSGTLAYAMGTGKATISTPYWYANEMLADGRGCIVPFKNANAIAKRVIDLLDNPVKRHAIRKKAYTFCRDPVWKEVARSYLKLFIEVKKERAFHPCPVFVKKTTVQGSSLELPEVKLDHLR
ncbi:MAG: glycosyltransferase family 4 protein, partial [Spirochaetes bacterium]|nr:glycosyltransferase family 4 protein [Spirochaetota bacterium]